MIMYIHIYGTKDTFLAFSQFNMDKIQTKKWVWERKANFIIFRYLYSIFLPNRKL